METDKRPPLAQHVHQHLLVLYRLWHGAVNPREMFSQETEAIKLVSVCSVRQFPLKLNHAHT